MARGGSKQEGGGGNTIRFIMLEANLNDGNLNQIAQAITNAVRQVAPQQAQRLLGASAPMPATNGAADVAEADEVDDLDPADEIPAASASKLRNRKPPKSPEIIADLDLTGDVSFESFAKQKDPQDHTTRYLTVATWFKRYKKQDVVTTDHVYTCYRLMDWPYGFEDYDGVFRTLKRQKLVARKAKGQYAINQVGEKKVDDLTAG